MQAALTYQQTTLQEECLNFIDGNTEVHDTLEIILWRYLNYNSKPCLKFSTLTFLLCIYLQSVWCTVQEVFKSQGFNELSEDALSFVLQSDQLQMDEEDILAKVTEWATVNSVSFVFASVPPVVQLRTNLQVVMGQTLGEVAVKVINHVRFGLLDPEKLSQIERENQQKNFVPVSLTIIL